MNEEEEKFARYIREFIGSQFYSDLTATSGILSTMGPEEYDTIDVDPIAETSHAEDSASPKSAASGETAVAGELEESAVKLMHKFSTMQSALREEEYKKTKDLIEEKKDGNTSHAALPEVLHMLKSLGIVFLVGPTGTGKSTLAKSACKELFSLEDDPVTSGKYAQISFSPDTTSGEMIGRTDVNGVFHESEIVRVFRDGGLILFDEIDDADASMLIKVNTALANGYLSTPNGMVLKNKDTYIVCAANTFGTGPDAMYVGRTRLDAATLDRFCLATIYVDYDTKLEERIASSLPENQRYWVLNFVGHVRDTIKSNKLRRACSTRFVINAVSHLLNGKSEKWIKDTFLQGWTNSEKAKVKD